MSSGLRPSFVHSLRFRLAAAYAGAFAVSLGLVLLFLFSLLHVVAGREADAGLVAEARRMLDLAARRKARIMQAEINRYAAAHGEDAVQIHLRFPGGETVVSSRAAWSPEADIDSGAPGVPVFAAGRAPDGEIIRSVALADSQGRSVVIRRPLTGLRREMRAAASSLFAAFLASLAIGSVVAYRLTQHALARIERVRSAAEAIAHGDYTRRVPLTARADELTALTRTFNLMIGKVESAMHELRLATDSLAHDFRTPLTRMRAAAELVLTSDESAKAPESALSLVVDECDRLERMSRTLLQIVHMDSGAYVAPQMPVDMEETVRDTIDLFAPSFDDRGITLRAVAPDSPLCVRGDRPLIERILANLLDNALKFTPAGGCVTVAAARRNDRAQLTVADTGSGIDPADLPHIFDRHYRGRHNPSASGFGLGLSFVQAAARTLGGDVRVESTPGSGSTFFVHLPLFSPPAPVGR